MGLSQKNPMVEVMKYITKMAITLNLRHLSALLPPVVALVNTLFKGSIKA